MSYLPVGQNSKPMPKEGPSTFNTALLLGALVLAAWLSGR